MCMLLLWMHSMKLARDILSNHNYCSDSSLAADPKFGNGRREQRGTSGAGRSDVFPLREKGTGPDA